MKRYLLTGVLLSLVSTSTFATPGSCDKIKTDIQQRITKNGVSESSFILTIVPNDQSDRPDTQVVGHCANDTQKILYSRTHGGNNPVDGTLPQDPSQTEPE